MPTIDGDSDVLAGAAAAAAEAVKSADAYAIALNGAPITVSVPETDPDAPEPEADDDADTGDAKSPSKSPLRKKKKRICKFPGCTKTVKAQGHCQRHGAKTKRCKAPNCSSQAQGSHEGYCKRHWREFAAPEDQRKKAKKPPEEPTSCVPVGSSVYDHILPMSFAWKADSSGKSPKKEYKRAGALALSMGAIGAGDNADEKSGIMKAKEPDEQTEVVPILQHLVDNEHLDAGWHRANERLARGIRPPKSTSIQLESWEKQLSVMEMALIAGTDTKHVSQHRVNKVLAHAWGREKGFHKIIVEKHCARRGDLDRKKRVDAGMPMTAEKKAAYKLKKGAGRGRKRKMAEVLEEEEGKTASDNAEEADDGLPTLPPVCIPAPVEGTSTEEQPDESGGEQLPSDPLPPLEDHSMEVEEAEESAEEGKEVEGPSGEVKGEEEPSAKVEGEEEPSAKVEGEEEPSLEVEGEEEPSIEVEELEESTIEIEEQV